MGAPIAMRAAVAFVAALALAPLSPVAAAEATTGTIVGSVTAPDGGPIAGARVSAASPSGAASALTDVRGHFVLVGLVQDTYTVSAEAKGYDAAVENGVVVLPGSERELAFHLVTALRTIARVHSTVNSFVPGATSDTFTVSGGDAAALSPPPVSSSGLANYISGTVQGAIASVPGVSLDAFANAIPRGGKIDDAVFDYDSVPVPQGLIAEPGGNVIGAQLPTTGVASTNVTLSGYETQGDNALGGVVDEIPAVGTYPGHSTVTLGDGVGGPQYQFGSFELLNATPDKRIRYALSGVAASQYFAYGDGSTFYPSEAATYGLSLQSRGEYSVSSNVHYTTRKGDDLSVLALVGEANYDQYGTPYSGELWGTFNGDHTTFPGQTDPNAQVTFPSRIRGTYDVLKAQWLHSGAHSLSRVQVYQSQFGSVAGGPFWDENGYPDGSISLFARQGGRETGIGYDGDDVLSERNHLRFGAEFRTNTSFLDQIVPTADEVISSNPTLQSYLGYVGDTWSPTRTFDLMGALRATETHNMPSFGTAYDVGAIDPHLSAAYHLGPVYALRATYDHTTVAPKPLEVDRVDSSNTTPSGAPAPFVQLAPEVANNLTFSLEGGGRTQFRLTYFADLEKNRIDVLPFNFRSAVAGGLNPNGVGVPTNIGELRAHGAELWARNGGFTLGLNYIHALSSSASQFAYNDLNAPAIAAGHLFPNGYVPDFTANASYELRLRGGHVRIAPSIAYEDGYPYGNGTMAWTFAPNSSKPMLVKNDNFVNPGANYYFLMNPNKPFNATTNPYIGNLGTPEGPDPNTLRAAPQLLTNLHMEADLNPRVTVIFDVTNLFDVVTPSAYQLNPYLIGPPGYAGGNPFYEQAYAANASFSTPYVLGNGVPTNDGVHQAVPWTYGRGGYIPQNYPNARAVHFTLRFRT
jgi:hypothetical protein